MTAEINLLKKELRKRLIYERSNIDEGKRKQYDTAILEKLVSLKEYREVSAGHKDAQRVLTRVHNRVDLSYDRIQLYKRLAGREDTLKAMAAEGRFAELETELDTYLAKLKKYRDLGFWSSRFFCADYTGSIAAWAVFAPPFMR